MPAGGSGGMPNTEVNECGWPLAGSIVVPAGARCYSVTTSDPWHVAMLRTTEPEACPVVLDGQCPMHGCGGIMSVLPGELIEVWGAPEVADPMGTLVVEPSQVCCSGGVCTTE
jgi:hypothetical protein